ncbi:XRE family transcriptional regulator [Streptomyces albus]|uniref:XRE family transcriptional regulator n=1 Tax=Streptomyces albus TaxID=1888 RepID=UPI001FC95A93|nr:XRE family transcriptional regulator [Streptomyces albus]
MGTPSEPSPHEARDSAGFAELMKQLKERSGLTYRELEEQAARNGDVLARSTLADLLRRAGLPRPDVLAAFVRACGDGQRVGVWLDARERIVAQGAAPHLPVGTPAPATARAEGGARPVTEESASLRQRRGRTRVFAVAAALAAALSAAVLFAVGIRGFPPTGSGGTGHSDGPDARKAAATDVRTVTDGWVTIRPARETDLCLTEGRDRKGAYGSAVAVNIPCAAASVPRTYLEPAGENLYRIQWHHPELGKGCLTVMTGGPVNGMLEPRDDCARATLFRVESATNGSTGFRLRPAHSSQCIGTTGGDAVEGAEVVQEPCTGDADQYFVIRAS